MATMSDKRKEVEKEMIENIKSLNTRDKLVSCGLYNILQERYRLDDELQTELKEVYNKYAQECEPIFLAVYLN